MGNKKKETDAVKEKLQNYATLRRRLENKIERLVYLESIISSPSRPNLSGLPGGDGSDSSKVERQATKKDEIEREIQEMQQEERNERKELESLIKRIKNPDEQAVVEMRYLDNAKWWNICAALFGDMDDYDKHEQRYLKRTFKIHGSALLSLAKICAEYNQGIKGDKKGYTGVLYCKSEETVQR